MMNRAVLLTLLLCSAVAGWARAADGLVDERVTLQFDGDASRPISVRVVRPDRPRALVIYTHGFLDNFRNHERLVGALLSRRCAVAAWDLIGHGASFGMRGHVESFDDYARALDLVRRHAVAQVPAGTPVILLGHSLGALVTLRHAEQHPEGLAGTALLAPFLEAKMSPVRKVLNSISGAVDHVFPKLETPHGVTNGMMFRVPEILAERRRDPYFFEKITVHLFREMQAGIKAAFRDAARLRGPLLFLVAGDELIVEREATDRFYAKLGAGVGKQYELFPNARHELHSDTGREQVIASLLGWVETQLKSGSFSRLYPAAR